MININEALGEFFSGTGPLASKESSVLEGLKEAADAMEAEDKKHPETQFYAGGCAYIAYRDRCGFAKAGNAAYVVNRLRNRSVKVTVSVSWRSGINRGTYQVTRSLPPGGYAYLGCTMSGSIPVTYLSFRVDGCAAA